MVSKRVTQHQLSNVRLLLALQLREVNLIRLAFTEYFEKMKVCVFAFHTCLHRMLAFP